MSVIAFIAYNFHGKIDRADDRFPFLSLKCSANSIERARKE